MKKISIWLTLLALPAFADSIAPTEASKHVGETVVVQGVASVYQSRSGVTFVHMGGAGRNAPFTGVIFKDKASAFSDLTNMTGKTVDMSGTIKLYQGKPEIVLDSPAQLKVH